MTTHCSKHRAPRVPTLCCNVMYQCFCRGRRWFSSQKLLHIYRRPYVDSVDERVQVLMLEYLLQLYVRDERRVADLSVDESIYYIAGVGAPATGC